MKYDDCSTYLHLVRNKYSTNKIATNTTKNINNSYTNPTAKFLQIS